MAVSEIGLGPPARNVSSSRRRTRRRLCGRPTAPGGSDATGVGSLSWYRVIGGGVTLDRLTVDEVHRVLARARIDLRDLEEPVQ